MDISSINWMAVAIATVLAWLFGAAWYMSLSKPWLAASRLDPATMSNSKAPYAVSFILEFLLATVMALLIGTITAGEATVTSGLFFGFVFWLGFVFTTLATNHRYHGYGWDLTLLDGGHWLGALLIMGAVIGYFSGAPMDAPAG